MPLGPRRHAIATVAATLLALSLAQVAHAQLLPTTTTTEETTTTTTAEATTTTTATTAPPALSVATPDAVSGGTVSASDGRVSFSFGTVTVTDARGGSARSWIATVAATDFVTGGGTPAETIPKANVTYGSGDATATSGTAVPVPGQAADPLLPVSLDSPRKAFSSSGGVGTTSVSWTPTVVISFSAETAPGLVTARIDAPADAAPGERYGVIWTELPSEAGVSGDVVHRVGVRVYLWVGSEAPTTDFSIAELAGARDETGTTLVEALVRNTGDRALDLSGTIQVEQDGGTTDEPLPMAGGVTVAPGAAATMVATGPERLTDGPATVTATVDGGGIHRRARGTGLTFPDEPGSRAAAVEARAIDGGSARWPSLVAAAALAAAAAATAQAGVRRLRSRPSRRSGEPAPPDPARRS